MARAIDDPLGVAEQVTTKASARKLWDRIDAERADRQLDPDWLADADQAQALLEERFLSVDMDSPTSSGDADSDTGDRSPKSSGARAGGGGAGGRGSGRRRGKSSGAGRRARKAGKVGKAAAGSLPGFSATGPIITAALWGTLSLVLLYVIVRSASVSEKTKGPNVIDMFATGLTTGLQVLIAPVDPLAPRTARKDAAVANAAGVRQVLVDGVPLNKTSSPVRRPALTNR
ncbi:MAG TPA: hypothetical protein VN962_05400 [Polyangia bacterium]|nr:hypothetical protein [Polyangia bacterium]